MEEPLEHPWTSRELPEKSKTISGGIAGEDQDHSRGTAEERAGALPGKSRSIAETLPEHCRGHSRDIAGA